MRSGTQYAQGGNPEHTNVASAADQTATGERPFSRRHSDCCVGKDQLVILHKSAHVVRMRMRDEYVGDIAWLHTSLVQRRLKRASHACVDQDDVSLTLLRGVRRY